MSEYLSKEEIKQWRSSLEKITLEEFAARLGKKIEETKPTNDLVDIVLKGQPVVSTNEEWNLSHAERLTSIAERAYEIEREIYPSSFSINKIVSDDIVKSNKTPKKAVKNHKPEAKPLNRTVANAKKQMSDLSVRDEVHIVFKKALTDREQKVFDFFAQNKGEIVYAKDLASILDLPRDYVYKYIKNLRAKIDGDKLHNADKGGFILSL